MSTAVAPAPTTDEPEEKKPRRARLLLVVLVVAILAGAGWFYFLRPSGESGPKPGEVVTLEPIQVNLAGGHYLRLGIALQLTEDAHEAEGSKALDAAIDVFSGLPVGDVNQPQRREELRHQLDEKLHERYHGDVMGVYFTEYVTQ